jgi:flagellar biosynthetic protein FliR
VAVTPFDEVLRTEAAGFVLETVRIAGLVIAAPLSWTAAPARTKAALVLLLAGAAHGQTSLPSELTGSPGQVALAAGSEFMLGIAIGMIVRLAIGAVEVCAEQVSLMMGLGVAQIFDPQAQATQTVIATILRNFALLVALGVGLHRLVIGATLASFQALPVGSLISFQAYGGTFAALGGVLLETGLRLAMPVVAVLLMTQIALAFISRAAPQIQIFSIGFAVTLAVGAFVVFATLPDLGSELAVEMSRVEGRIEGLVAAILEGT